MADGLRAFRRIQVGTEAAHGTAVAATEPLLGTIGIASPGMVIHQPDEERNSLARNVADDVIVGKETQLVWTGDLNFRHILWPMLMGIRSNITPTQPDSTNEPSAYLWTIAPSLTTANTPDQANGISTFTMEYGDNVQGYETEYCFATRIEISGAPNAPVQFTCDITGRQQTETTFTSALTYSSGSSLQRAPFNLAAFYIDTSGANLGNTAKTGTLKAFTWTLETMFAPLYTADGALYFTSLTEDKKKVVLNLTYARNTISESERDKFDARTTTFIRIKLNGSTEMDSSQSNPPYLILDGAYRYFAWPDVGEENGLTTVEVVAESVYDATWAKQFQVALLTNLSALPT